MTAHRIADPFAHVGCLCGTEAVRYGAPLANAIAMRTIANLACAIALVLAAGAGCKKKAETASTATSGSAVGGTVMQDPTMASPAPANAAVDPSLPAVRDAAIDALGSAATPPTVVIAPTAVDGGSAPGAVNGTTNGAPSIDAF